MTSAPFIAFSLILLLAIGILALFLGGKTSASSNCDDPKEK